MFILFVCKGGMIILYLLNFSLKEVDKLERFDCKRVVFNFVIFFNFDLRNSGFFSLIRDMSVTCKPCTVTDYLISNKLELESLLVSSILSHHGL